MLWRCNGAYWHQGVNLALVDRDADAAAIHDGMNQLVTVSVHRLDLVDAVGIATLPSAVLALPKVDMLLITLVRPLLIF